MILPGENGLKWENSFLLKKRAIDLICKSFFYKYSHFENFFSVKYNFDDIYTINCGKNETKFKNCRINQISSKGNQFSFHFIFIFYFYFIF